MTKTRTFQSHPAARAAAAHRGGFAVPVVVFMLASVMLLMGTGYEMIRVVGDVRAAGRDAIIAEKSGEAAVSRTMGERLGTPADSQVIYLGDFTRIKVKARRMGRSTAFRSTYLLTGVVEQGEHFPATRTVREYAILEPPVEATAVLANVAGNITVNNGATINGTDAATSGACVVPTGNIGGAYAAGSISASGSTVNGNPSQRTVSTRAAALSALSVKWEMLTGPEVPVQYSSAASWPSFASMHVDTFPVIRINGDLTVTSAHSGRGALIVTGTFRPGSSFSWNGVIFAGNIVAGSMPTWTLRGLMVTGMDAAAGPITIPTGANLQYNRCHVMRAFAKLSHLEPVAASGWTER